MTFAPQVPFEFDRGPASWPCGQHGGAEYTQVTPILETLKICIFIDCKQTGYLYFSASLPSSTTTSNTSPMESCEDLRYNGENKIYAFST